LAFACFSIFMAKVYSAELVGKIIAVINGEAIYLSEFENNWVTLSDQTKRLRDKELTPEEEAKQKEMLLNQMVEDKLLAQEAKRRAIKISKRELEEGIMTIKNRFKNFPSGYEPTKNDLDRELKPDEKVEFYKELKKQNLTEKDFSDKIESRLQVMSLTNQEINSKVSFPFKHQPKPGEKPDPNDVTDDYDKEAHKLYVEIEKRFTLNEFKPNPDDEIDQMTELLKSKLGETVRARHILIRSSRSDNLKERSAALQKAKDIKKQLDGGADFTELAKKYNEGPAASNGGDLGYFAKGQMVPEFDRAVFALNVGHISDVVETPFGYHIIKVEEKKAAQKLRYDDIKVDLVNVVYQKRMEEKFNSYVDELKKKADIKIQYTFDNSTAEKK